MLAQTAIDWNSVFVPSMALAELVLRGVLMSYNLQSVRLAQ